MILNNVRRKALNISFPNGLLIHHTLTLESWKPQHFQRDKSYSHQEVQGDFLT